MGLFEDLRKLSEQFKQYLGHVKGEEQTKHVFVQPFLQVLGYNAANPLEVKAEYTADFATRRSSGQLEKVDYLLLVKGVPAIFVECKAVDKPVEAHDGQLKKYFNSTPSVRLAVITNGLQWRFFTDIDKENIMDEVPFLEVNMLNVTERAASLLEPLTKAQFDSAKVTPYAEDTIALVKATGFFHDLLREPSQNFVEFVIRELKLVGDKKLYKSDIVRFEPIIKKSIETALLEMVTKPIKQMQEEAPAPPAPAPAPQPVVQNAKPSQAGPNIVTTEEELAIFDIVKKICADSPAKVPVVYKDGANYFAINLGPETSWFLRLYAGTYQKSFIVRMAPAKAEPLVKDLGFTTEAITDQPGQVKVKFGKAADVERLRPLILQAYEAAAAQQNTQKNAQPKKTP